jgi:hypothetical protein
VQRGGYTPVSQACNSTPEHCFVILNSFQDNTRQSFGVLKQVQHDDLLH